SKQRNGPIGNIKLFFEAEKGRFKNYTAKYNPADFNV
ncbi:replicative DNA helicase, partial [Ehrlichia ruminantium]